MTTSAGKCLKADRSRNCLNSLSNGSFKWPGTLAYIRHNAQFSRAGPKAIENNQDGLAASAATACQGLESLKTYKPTDSWQHHQQPTGDAEEHRGRAGWPFHSRISIPV